MYVAAEILRNSHLLFSLWFPIKFWQRKVVLYVYLTISKKWFDFLPQFCDPYPSLAIILQTTVYMNQAKLELLYTDWFKFLSFLGIMLFLSEKNHFQRKN